jgi:hypothetical protein
VFQTHVASVSAVSDVCCKCFIWMLQKYMGVAHVAMRVRRGESASGHCTWSGGAGPTWAREMKAQTGACWPERGTRVSIWKSGH